MHILQRHSKRTKVKDIAAPSDAAYDFAAGVWRNAKGLLAFDPSHQLSTKKNDVETGEDQKGE